MKRLVQEQSLWVSKRAQKLTTYVVVSQKTFSEITDLHEIISETKAQRTITFIYKHTNILIEQRKTKLKETKDVKTKKKTNDAYVFKTSAEPVENDWLLGLTTLELNILDFNWNKKNWNLKIIWWWFGVKQSGLCHTFSKWTSGEGWF